MLVFQIRIVEKQLLILSWVKTLGDKMDKQQGPTVQHRELYSISRDKP